MTDFNDYVEHAYDDQVANSGRDGITRADAIEKIAHEAAMAVEEGRLEIPDVTRAVRDAVVAIDKRRNTESNFRAILEGLNGETIVPLADDPYMNRAWVIGKGLRKLGMYLRIEDLDQIMSNKRQNVTSVVARYEDEAAAVDVIKARMRAGGFSEMGELRQ